VNAITLLILVGVMYVAPHTKLPRALGIAAFCFASAAFIGLWRHFQ
jgi:hypothetical protein